MVSKNIAIKKEIYDRLEMRKKPKESFSDVIERLLDIELREKDITRCLGIWNDVSDNLIDEMKENNAKMREMLAERFR